MRGHCVSKSEPPAIRPGRDSGTPETWLIPSLCKNQKG